jgi:hypothetical protein
MKHMVWPIALFTVLLDGSLSSGVAATVTFDDLPLAANSFYNGADGVGQFASGGATLQNHFTDFGGGFSSWEGWSYSNKSDVTTPGFENQYSAYNVPAGGGFQSANFGVAYKFDFDPTQPDLTTGRITLPAGTSPVSLRVTNTTYGALNMRDGDPNGFSKKFGGATGNDADWFLLTILGLGANDQVIGQAPFYLADYRPAGTAQDYIVSQWTAVDLTPLAGARALEFVLSSTDNGTFGMNTPATFALDDLQFIAVPEPSSVLLASFGIGLLLLIHSRRTQP